MATEPTEAPRSEGLLVQRVLQGGVALAVALLAVGLAVQLAAGGHRTAGVRLEQALRAGLPLGERLMTLGVLVLAFTPVVRVVALLVLWLREGDRRFALVAAIVLATLGAAIAVGG